MGTYKPRFVIRGMLCGIAGFRGAGDVGLLSTMAAILFHRGPDDEGHFVDQDVGLVCRRLSIIDLDGGHQPMAGEDASTTVVFNGEIYNFVGLREQLETAGHEFASRSDTEVIVHGYEEWGDDLFPRLNGMYAIAVWDARRQVLVLARDKIGIKPLYYAQSDSTLAFASELKALLLVPGITQTLDVMAIDEYLSRRFPLGSRTPFQDIRRLGPGSVLRASNEKIEVRRFWQLPESGPSVAPSSEAEVRHALVDSITRQLVSDVPLGVSLSGGIDSSSIAAVAARASPSPISTFTAGFGEDTEETRAARKVAEHIGADHHEVTVSDEEMTRDITDRVWYMDEPVADPANMPTYYIMRFARKRVKVALLGEGADELFGGYSPYRLGVAPYSFLPIGLRRSLYHRVNLLFPADERRRLLAVEGVGRDDPDFLDSAFNSLPFSERMMRSELRRVLPRFQLHRVDRMSMAHSLEARVPYLDDVVVDVALRVPVRDKVSPFEGKRILRRAVKDLLPHDIVHRKKRIFGVPILRWLSETLGDAMEAQFDSSELLHQMFRVEAARKIMTRRTWAHDPRAAYKAWMLSVLDIWYRTFVEREPSEMKGPIRPPW